MKRRDFLKLAATAGALCILNGVGCGSGNDSTSETDGNSPSDTPPPASNPILSSSAILVVVDSLRADHVSAYGYQRRTTPYLDEFNKKACTFENAVSPSSWTMASFASLMTGLHAFHHNQHEAGVPNLPVFSQETLIEKLNNSGYNTVLMSANGIYEHLTYIFKESYGFANPDDHNGSDIAVIDRAMEWLEDESNLSQKFFMVLWLMSPHALYQIHQENGYLEEFLYDDLYLRTPPVDAGIECDSYGAIKTSYFSAEQLELIGTPLSNESCYSNSNLYIAAYDANIKFADEQIGRLFDFLTEKGFYDDLTLMFTSDHGENMVDHQVFFDHGSNLYNSLTHVPLMMKFSGQTESRKISERIRSIDAIPTFFDIHGLETGDIDGKSLLPVLSEEADLDDRPCISYHEFQFLGGKVKEVAIVSGDYKLIKSTQKGEELYDVGIDREETNNMAAEHPDIVTSLNLYLGDFFPLAYL